MTTTVVVVADRYTKKAMTATTNKAKNAAKVSQTGSRNGRRWWVMIAGASISISYEIFFMLLLNYAIAYCNPEPHRGLCTIAFPDGEPDWCDHCVHLQ